MGLGLLILMVREAQVNAAAVDVESVAQVASAHGRALQVPAGAAASPGGVPGGVGRFAWFSGFPQGKVAWVAFISLDGVVNLRFILS